MLLTSGRRWLFVWLMRLSRWHLRSQARWNFSASEQASTGKSPKVDYLVKGVRCARREGGEWRAAGIFRGRIVVTKIVLIFRGDQRQGSAAKEERKSRQLSTPHAAYALSEVKAGPRSAM